MDTEQNFIQNLDSYIDDLDYFKPLFYFQGMEILKNISIQNNLLERIILECTLKFQSESCYKIYKSLEFNQLFLEKLVNLIKPKTEISRSIKSFSPNIDRFNQNSQEAYQLIRFENIVKNEMNNRFYGMMTTITYPPSFSFHDTWLIVEKHRELSLNLIRESGSLMSISTIEYMHSGEKKYRIKCEEQIKWFYSLISIQNINDKKELLKNEKYGFDKLTETKLPYIYNPGMLPGKNGIQILIDFYKSIRNIHCYELDKEKKRIYTKDRYRELYGDIKDIPKYSTRVNRKTGEVYNVENIDGYSPPINNELQKVSRNTLLKSLFNYFHIILFNRKNHDKFVGFIDRSIVKMAEENYKYIRDIMNENNSEKLNSLLDLYFPIFTVNEIGISKGVFNIDGSKILEQSEEEYENFKRIHNYYTYSNNFYIEYTFYAFLAFQHLQNGLSNVGYPHIHIYFMVDAINHKDILNLKREINSKISEALDLEINQAVLTELKEEETFWKGIGYIMKNSKSQFVDKMLTQVDEKGNRIRDSKDPILYLDYYNKDLYTKTKDCWYSLMNYIYNDDTKTFLEANKSSSFLIENENLPLRIRTSFHLKDIFRELISEFYPEYFYIINRDKIKDDILNEIFGIKYIPNDGTEETTWINFLQHYMVKNKLVVSDGYIYKYNDDSKYTFELYIPSIEETPIMRKSWDSSIECFIQSFSLNISPKAPSKVLMDKLILKFRNLIPGKIQGFIEIPCILINFRLIEYEDFILDIINRCTYSTPPTRQYCGKFINKINKSNILEKVTELLQTSLIDIDNFKFGSIINRTPLGLLRHLNLYNIHSLNILYEMLNVRIRKDSLILLAGDSSSYKSSMTYISNCIFPEHRVGILSDLSNTGIAYNVIGKDVVICHEANRNLESIMKQERAALLAITGGEKTSAGKKFKDVETFSTESTSVTFCINIDEKIHECLKKQELQMRSNINIHRRCENNLGVVTQANYEAIIGELLYLVCICSLSINYFNCERLPILHHYDEVPEPLERIHLYYLCNCDTKRLVKRGESSRSALDIRDFEYRSITTHEFINLPTEILPSLEFKSKNEMFRELIAESESKNIDFELARRTEIFKINHDVNNKLKLLSQSESQKISTLGYIF